MLFLLLFLTLGFWGETALDLVHLGDVEFVDFLLHEDV